MSDLLVDHALTLLLADEPEAALRWGAAALQHDPATPGALVVTSRLLEQMGRKRAAIDGLRAAVRRAIESGNVALAIAAIDDLRTLGVDVSEHLDQVADAFCEGSARLDEGQAPPLLPVMGDIQPLSPFLAGPSLASKATQILQAAKRASDEGDGQGQSPLAPVPLFSALSKEALRDLLAAFDMATVPAGHRVVQEGQDADAVYFVARGELEISRRAAEGENKPRLVLSRIGAGAFFGEMALLGNLPVAASVRATRPSILLVARRETLAEIASKHPEAARELAAHCRRHLVANLGWASPVVAAIPAPERAMLVERLQTRLFAKGDMLINDRDEAHGLHLIVSGEVAVVGHDRGERVVLATLAAGETVGEVELVLCRPSNADAIAVRPTATLFLPRHEFYGLVQDQPAILHGLYGIAVQRHTETQFALDAGSAAIAEEWMLEESTEIMERPASNRVMPRLPAPPPIVGDHDQTAFATSEPAQDSTLVMQPQAGSASGVNRAAPEIAGRSTAIPSYAPTSTSVPPRHSSLPAERRLAARPVILPVAAVVAIAASVITVVGLRSSRQADTVGAASRTAMTANAAASPVTPPATPTPSPPAATLAAAETPMMGKAPAPVPTTTRVRSRAAAKPRPVVVADVSPPAASASPAAASASAAASPSAISKPSTESKWSASAAAASGDEFGGRE